MTFLRRFYTTIIFGFLYIPIIVLIAYSFNASKFKRFDGFTLDWYAALFRDTRILSALNNTLIIGLLAALISTILGTIAALGIAKMRPLGQGAVMNLTYIPVLNPDIVTGISMMVFFIYVKIPLGFSSLLLAHITFCMPYVILSVLPRIQQSNQLHYEAALDLGATPWQALRKVMIPEIFPGIVTGFLLAFTLSIDDFVVSYFTTGPGVSNLSIEIYSMTRRGIKPEINALSTLIFVSVLVLLILINFRKIKEEKEMRT